MNVFTNVQMINRILGSGGVCVCYSVITCFTINYDGMDYIVTMHGLLSRLYSYVLNLTKQDT